MNLQFLATLSMAVIVLLVSSTTDAADPHEYAAVSSVSAMEQRIALLESRLESYDEQSFSSLGCDALSVVDSCCASDCSAGFTFGGEIAFLQFGNSGGAAGSYTYQPAARAWLGYQRSDGLGVRGRLFHYQDGQTVPPSAFISDVQITTVDVEVTHTFVWGNWDGVIAGGIRYSDYQESYLTPPVVTFSLDNGYGPTVSIELTRSVNDWISIFGMVRESVIMTDLRSIGISDLTYNVTELQVGLEARRPTRGNAFFFARGALEAQSWNDASLFGTSSLMGGSIAIGLAR